MRCGCKYDSQVFQNMVVAILGGLNVAMRESLYILHLTIVVVVNSIPLKKGKVIVYFCLPKEIVLKETY
jgi:hypothetical protein